MPHHKQWIVANRTHLLELSYAVERTMRWLGFRLMDQRALAIQEQNELSAGLRDIYNLQKLLKGAPTAHSHTSQQERGTLPHGLDQSL